MPVGMGRAPVLGGGGGMLLQGARGHSRVFLDVGLPAQDSVPTHVSKLHEAQLTQLAHTGVGSRRGQQELDQGHLFTPEHGTHDP